jgi:hypothetical protein
MLATNPTWVDPITELIRIEWNEPVDCAFGESRGCLRSVPFTVERLTCDGGVLGVLRFGGTFDPPDLQGKIHDGRFALRGIPQGIGPVTVTAVVRGLGGETHTLTVAAHGDRVQALTTECWTVPQGAFPPRGTRCGATRAPGDDIYVVLVGHTAEHGDFTVQHDGHDSRFSPAEDPVGEGLYFDVPEATPADLRWSVVFVTPATSASAIKIPAGSTVDTVSFRWRFVLAGELTATASVPPLAP